MSLQANTWWTNSHPGKGDADASHRGIAEHYDVQESPFARTYQWSPKGVVVECSKCGKRGTYKRSEIIGSEVTECECGKVYAARIREELVIRVLDEEYEAHLAPLALLAHH